ncbi:class II aldolase/adducin family protein [Streptomyces sp. LBUM 1478]|uniref:class II aldolase/adducin family protein n=1 Tax=Streptomyces scabiei TaxID=1930 RepID=UPI000765F95B|nr:MULTISPECIES: class II aldolase/adducin family protein [Streptomyces]MBP5864506.1 class II aldolase/adducin family protein [Streptomyces sp. LBUM 1484]MBP5905240.1 class II aldolase/adducin family protein [Streptomyces sp. LBUM 1478]MBP5932448.1 class II aldolase/adducin family protein [Streptomyces sp. LBUM 1479]MBP5898657.1 class II aldolase/adducin family protein [Streptomyces sp. LBUM 1488]MDX2534031.1 class II aldolase/adducin family protein [Streptomyces scabiei]
MAEQRRDVRDERGVDEVNEADDDARDARGAGRREMPDEVARAWDELVATARRTVADGLVVGTSGNVSVRVGDTLLVTPTGVPYDRLTPDDVTGVDLTGRQVLGTLRPTSELPMHLAIHTTAGARAVVHTHAVHATAVSTLVDELPLIHYMSAALGGPVRVAPYATYGTPELAENMLRALRGRTACLLRNHGTIAYGDSLDEAYDRTTQLEWMCQVWLKASSVPHLTPHLLTLGQLAETGERLKGYGQPG